MKELFFRFREYFKHLQEKESEAIKHGVISNMLFLVGSLHICFVFITLLVSAITFALGLHLTAVQFFVSMGITIFLAVYGSGVYFPRGKFPASVTVISLLLLTFSSCLLFASRFYDLSYDGQWYHQDILVKLAEGWNPFYQHLSTSEIPTANILNYYPKAAEILQATLYKVTGSIEMSKMFNPWLGITAFYLVLAVLLKIRKLPNVLALIISVLVVLNPVSITEMISYYIDGQVYALMLSLVALLILCFYTKKSFILLPLFAVLGIIINIKLTAVVFAALFIFGMLLYCWYSEKIHVFTKVFLTCAASFIVSFFFIGFNPFMTNVYYYHNPVYPAAGKGSMDYVTINGPRNYFGKNSVELLVLSTFAESDFQKGINKYATLKKPFTYTEKELAVFVSTDPIEGGFGPLFSGAIIVAASIYALSLRQWRAKAVHSLLLIAGLVLVSCLLVAASFYARFIPQYWLIPCIAVLLGFAMRGWLSKLLSLLLIGVLFVNVFLITRVNFVYNVEQSRKMQKQLQMLAEITKKDPILVNFGDFALSNRVRFQEAGIQFAETKHALPCDRKVRMLGQLVEESLIQACETPSLVNEP